MQLSQPAPLLNFFVRGHERWGKRKGVRNLFEKSRLKRFLTGSVENLRLWRVGSCVE